MLRHILIRSKKFSNFWMSDSGHVESQGAHTICLCKSDCYFIVNVLDLPFASLPIAICRYVVKQMVK